jgi:hypothetical protein
MKKAFLALTVAVAGLTVGATQLWATTKTADVTVGDGVHACSGATFHSAHAINDAILATPAGKTIKVCSGSYNAVNVTKPMTINGTSLLLTTAQCIAPAANPAKDASKYSVIEGGVTLNADNVKVSGFTIQNNNGGAGITTGTGTDGLTATKNVIQGNTMGVYLNGGAVAGSKVNGNCIRQNNKSGSASGNGIYSDQGLDSAQINSNAFYNNPSGGINLPAGSLTDIFIGTNTSEKDSNFVSATGSENLVIKGNTVNHALGGAVFLDGSNTHTQITGNTFQTGDDDGIGIGGPANDHVLIYGNTIKSNTTLGIDTNPNGLVDSLISKNTVTSNGDGGIQLLNTGNDGNFITDNAVTLNNSDADNCVDEGDGNTWFNNNVECTP